MATEFGHLTGLGKANSVWIGSSGSNHGLCILITGFFSSPCIVIAGSERDFSIDCGQMAKLFGFK